MFSCLRLLCCSVDYTVLSSLFCVLYRELIINSKMASCVVCSKKITNAQVKVKCEDCDGLFHSQCVKMSKQDVEALTAEGLVWRCDPCASTRRKSMRLETQATVGGLNVEDVLKILKEIREEQTKTVTDFNKSYEVLHEQMEANTAAVTAHTKRVDDLMDLVQGLVTENKVLKKRIAVLEGKFDDQEQYARRNTIEIQGVPQVMARESQEQVLGLVRQVGAGLGYEIRDDMIDACHRLGQKVEGERPPGIVVKFVRRIDKDCLLQKRREKKDFSTRHMGLACDTSVYLNESITKARRVLFAKTREFKKNADYKYCWQRGGKMFLREKEGEKVITINCQEDLDKLQ